MGGMPSGVFATNTGLSKKTSVRRITNVIFRICFYRSLMPGDRMSGWAI